VVPDLKAQLPHDISVGGPTLAAHAIRTGLVDEYHLFVVPMMIGGGKRVLPSNVCVKLDLLDERRFANGMVYLRYRTQACWRLKGEGERRIAAYHNVDVKPLLSYNRNPDRDQNGLLAGLISTTDCQAMSMAP
jgi:RibD domain-containing protein